MAAGLFALLDDVAALARIAAASVDDVGAAASRASMKAAGVVVDDTAVTPQFLEGSPAKRELPMIRQIAIGSMRNKLLFILPVALLLSEFVPWLLPILLIFGGSYLAFEGAEKVWEKLSGHGESAEEALTDTAEFTPAHEKRTVSGAIRTDFILSAEIMVISLKEVVDSQPDAGLVLRAAILAVVAVMITLAVYGVVAFLVKMDDVGVLLTQRSSEAAQRLGRLLVIAMPKVLSAIAVIGTAAMLWVGGHILLISLDELSGSLNGVIAEVLHAPYGWVHHWEVLVRDAVQGSFGATLGWILNTLASAVIGLAVGAVLVALMHVMGFGHGAKATAEDGDHEPTPEDSAGPAH